eukprot:maker-scaffold_8-snap-gene-13.53-mRNA-1 protein AED:0.00 eAED:0.00 QI:198/1/1/1/1/1/2/327/380
MRKIRVLLCGKNFPFAEKYILEEIKRKGYEEKILIETVQEEKVKEELSKQKFDVAVPYMVRLTREHLINSGLKCVIQLGVGVEGVDFNAANEEGLYIQNAPCEQNSWATAEHAIYLALAAGRDPKSSEKSFEEGVLGNPLCTQIYGKNVVVLGMGAVGENIVKRLAAFSPKSITGMKRSQLSDEKQVMLQQLSKAFGTAIECIPVQLQSLKAASTNAIDPKVISTLQEADYLFLSCVLTDETKLLVGSNFIKLLKEKRDYQKRFVINVGRGPLVSSIAMLQALDAGVIDCFASDVGCIPTKVVDGELQDDFQGRPEPFSHDEPLARHEKTIFTPHLGGVAGGSYQEMSQTMVANLISMYQEGKPLSWLNSPQVKKEEQVK